MVPVLLAVLAALLAWCYLLLRRQYRFWAKLGVPGPQPQLVIGNMAEVFRLQMTEPELLDRYYKAFPEQDYVGMYNLWNPVLLVRNAGLVKAISETDFSYFINRPTVNLAHTDAAFSSLFFLQGEEWRVRRQRFTNLYTPRRLKEYATSFKTSLARTLSLIRSHTEQDIDIINFFDRPSGLFIAELLYGLDLSVEGKTVSKLLEMSAAFTNPSAWTTVKYNLYSVAPALHRLLRLATFPPKIYNFFQPFTKDLIRQSNTHFVTLIKKLLEEGIPPNKDRIEMDEAGAHVYLFFMASHHTSLITMCHTLHKLVLHPDVQARLHAELDKVLATGEDLSYDSIGKLVYLEAVINETMRLEPLVGVLKRVCDRDYELKDGVTLPKGTEVLIPVASIQMDPLHYPEPLAFRPERFLQPSETPFMPFGRGPRSCIGNRLAMMLMKLLLAGILLEFRVVPSNKMTLPMRYDPSQVIITNRPINGIWIRFVPRNKLVSPLG